jgi:multiple sugar transport system substrate-binding protein
MTLDRRNLLKLSAAAGLALPFGSGLTGSALAADIALRLYWWGGADRARRTLAVGELFSAAHSGVAVGGEPVGADYWPKLATMMVGRNLPDVVQFEPSTIADYARRGATLPLDQYIPSTIKTGDLAPGVLDLARVDGQVHGIALGLNAFSMFYNVDLFQQVGLAEPAWGLTWDEYAKLAVELTKAAGRDKLWGSPNGARYNYVFQAWLHQRGKLLFSEDGGLGFTVDDAREWYDYWDKLDKAGGCVSADLQSMDQSLIDSNPLTRGNSAMAFTFSNQTVGYQAVLQHKVGIAPLPIAAAGGSSGLFYRPALIWSVGKTSKNPDMAAAFIDFFVNDTEAGKVLGAERGVPVNVKVREVVAPTLDATAVLAVNYITEIADKVRPYPPISPEGSNEFDHRVMRPVADQLGFGNISVKEAAELLVADGKRVLKRG